MPELLSSRQWRAIATVYGLYAPAQRDMDANDAEEIAQAALPLLQRAFPPEFLSRQPLERKREREEPAASWQRHIPAPIDAYLSRLLCVEAVRLSDGERRLLRLLSRERRRVDEGAQRDAELRESILRAAEKLQLLAGTNETPGECHGLKNNVHNHDRRSKSKSHRQSGGEEKCVSAAPALHARVTQNDQSTPAEAPARPLTIKSPASAPVNTTVVDFTCTECGESGGELFQCRHCHGLRHEACGGPMIESETGFCAKCCHELGLSVSASSLRESTSTEERMSDEESDTSLSGFIVDTDEDEDEEEESEESRSSSHVTPPKKCKKEKRRNA